MWRSTVIAVTGWVVLAIAWAALLIPLAVVNAWTDTQPPPSTSEAGSSGASADAGSLDSESFCLDAAQYGTAAQPDTCMAPARTPIRPDASHSPSKMES